ncbi:MAG: FtsX-like permease family protein [Candidatus Heimdallarchaeota archaeon]
MRILERLKIFYKMLLLNRRNTVVMFLGLGISLAMISEGLIFIYSFQYDAFTSFNKETPTRQFTIKISLTHIIDREDVIISEILNITNSVLDNIGITDRVLRTDWISERDTYLYVGPRYANGTEKLLTDFTTYGLPPDYFSIFETLLLNGTLPHKIDEVVVVTKRSIIESTNLSKLGTFPAYVPVLVIPPDPYATLSYPYGMNGDVKTGNYVNVTGVIASEDFENYKGILSDDFKALDEYLTDQFMLTTHKGVMNFVSRIEYLYGDLTFRCRMVFDLSTIDAFNIAGEIAMLNRLSQEILRAFENSNFELTVQPELIEQLRKFNEEFLIFQLFALLFTTPLIGMALSLTNYSANLMKKRQQRQVSSMLQRGASRKEVLSLLIFQVVEFTVVAMLICVIIGYPFAWFMMKSNGFLSFGGTSVFPSTSMIIFYTIIAAAFIFSTIVNAKNIWDTSNISTLEAYGTTVQRKPTWERTYLDVFLILLGIVLWLIVKIQLKGSQAYSFAYGFGTTAPICLVLGSILLVTRIYPYFISLLAKIGWKFPKLGILSLSAKRSMRRRGAVIHSLVLVTLTFTLIISSLTIIQSYQDFDSEQAYYQLGADILIKNVKVENKDMKDLVLAIEGVSSGTYLTFTSQVATYGSITYGYLLVGIDIEEFPKTAYFDKEYLGVRDALRFFSQIDNYTDVFMQKDELDKVNSAKGGQMDIIVEKYAQGKFNYTLDIVDTYRYFPRFFVEYPRPESTIYRFTIVGNYDFVNNLAYNDMNIEGDMLVKVADGYSISEVADAIELTIGRNVECVEDLMGTYEGSLRNTMLYGSLNTAFISSLVITVAAISLMIIIQSIENEMEVVMLKTLGMSPKQLFSMFTTEALSLILFGSIIGFIVAIGSATMFMDILTVDNTLPPVELVFPPVQIILSFSLLFVTSIGAAALTSWIIFRKDTIKGIKTI